MLDDTTSPPQGFVPDLSQTDDVGPPVPNLLAPDAPPPMSDEVVTDRAKRADYALGDQSPGVPQLKTDFQNGKEPAIRQSAASQADAEFKQRKLDAVRGMLYSGAQFTDKDMETLMALGNTPQANPSTVLEDKYAQNWVTTGVVGEPGKNLVFQSAFEKRPEETTNNVQMATNMASRALQAKGFVEELRAAHAQLPWVSSPNNDQAGKLGDMFKNVLSLGFREYVKERNLLTDPNTGTSLLPGSNKLEQVQFPYLLPHDQFLPYLRAHLGPGSKAWKESPSAALTMAEAVASFASSDAYIDNALAIANVASLLPVGAGLKAIGRIYRGVEQTSPAFQTGYQAAQDILRASSKPPVGKNVESAFGTAADILSSPSTPPKQGFYVPGAAIETRDHVGATPKSGATIQPVFTSEVDQTTNVPKIFNKDGVEVQLARTPEVGHYPVNVEQTPPVNTYTTSHGNFVHETNEEGRSVVNGRSTIYVSKKDSETLSQTLDENKNLQILRDDKGVYVGDKDAKRPGYMVRGSRVKEVSDTPKEGLYPVHIADGNDRQAFKDFGTRITRVDENQTNKVTLGPKIVEKEVVEPRKALADIIKSVAETDPQDALTKMGQQEAAAQVGAQKDLADKIYQNTPIDMEAIRRKLPSLFSPQTWFNNSSSLSRALKERYVREAEVQNKEISDALSNPVRVERMTKEAMDKALANVADTVKQKYNRLSDALLDQVNHFDPASNTYYVETRIGKRDGTLFDTSAEAQGMAKRYKISGTTVEQQGNKFYLSHIQHADETFKAARDGLIVTGNETPTGLIRSWIDALSGKATGLGSSFRTARLNVSDFQTNNRLVATHAPSILQQEIESAAKPLQAMTKTERQKLEQILVHNRDFMHEDGTRGMFYKTAGDFEQAYFDKFNEMPSPKQTAAYDAYVRLNDLDYVLRALQLHKDKARLGIRNYKVEIPTKDGAGLPATGSTDFFNGKEVPNLVGQGPKGEHANVYVVPTQNFTTSASKTVADAEMRAKIKSGEWKVLQVADPRSKPLMGATGIKDDIHFVVTDAFEDKAIQLGEGLPYQPGGHVIYTDPYFMKMPIMERGTKGMMTHFGDISIKTFANRREGEQWVAKYNEAREHLLNNRNAELEAMFNSGQFPENITDFKKWFTGGSFNANADRPFVLTEAGRDTFQSSMELRQKFPGLHEQWSSYDLTQSYNKEFLADRDRQLNTNVPLGQPGNPVYGEVPSKLMDPYTSLQTGLRGLVRERWMGDYKTSAAESWVQEFWHLFPQDTLPKDKLGQNPWYWMYHAEGNLDAGIAKTNPEVYTAAMVARKNILNFLGARDEVSSVLAGLQTRLLDKLEPKIGAAATGRMEDYILPAISNAPAYTRAAAFNAVIGMFNPAQLIQQAQGMAHVLALSPLNGLKGSTASALARMFRYTENPAILSKMFDTASALGWDRAHIEEAWNAWKAAGVHNIGGETAQLNNVIGPNVFTSGFKTFLDKGQSFFKWGESIVRDTSFFTAYADWRAANPTAKLTNREIGDIMNRFDTLSLNMTRASNAAYNEGLLSIPTQFWTWNARFAEQMLAGTLGGKGQLTMGEKARVLSLYSALYGIPATVGGVTFGLMPNANYEDIRTYALTHGINVHDKYVQALSEGIPAMMTNIMTGHETDFQRFSPNANQAKDILDGKKEGWQVLMGASGGFLANVAKTLYPFGKFATSALSGDLNEYPLKMNDLINLAENVSSFSNAEKSYLAFTAGKIWSKNDQIVDNNVDTFESFMLALGLNPKVDSDAFLVKNYFKTQKEVQEKMKPNILQNWTNGYNAIANGDVQASIEYFTRAKAGAVAAGFGLGDQGELLKQALGGQGVDVIDQAERMMITKMPEFTSDPTFKTYLNNLKKNPQ